MQQLTDTDNSESLSIVVSGVPDGATLSKGTDNGDGTWTLAAADLSELTITPNENFDGSFNLTVTATSEEADGGDTNIVTGNIAVTVSPEVDTSISISSIGGGEDTDIPLSISFNDNGDTDESVTAVTISGVPDGAILSAGTDNGDGSWTLTPAQLENLTITPPDDSGSDMNLSVSATVEENGTEYQLTSDLDIDVTPVADMPTLEDIDDVSGVSGEAIPITLSPAFYDTDGSETHTITIEDIPSGATLTNDAGDTLVITDGAITLSPDQLTGLAITTPDDYDDTFNLSVFATATESENSDTASTDPISIAVTSEAAGDTVDVDVTPTSGNEDTCIAIDLSSSITLNDEDGSRELASITLSGLPEGTVIKGTTLGGGGHQHGNGHGEGESELTTTTIGASGEIDLTGYDLSTIQIFPIENSDVDLDLNLAVEYTDTGGADPISASDDFTISINAQADAPSLTTVDASGAADSAIGL